MKFSNPFRPGPGQLPPFLAGRAETLNFVEEEIFKQETIQSNLIISGLRGLGKTVLLDTIKPMAISKGWLWAGSDLSEIASLTEQSLADRIITDISTSVSSFRIIPSGQWNQKMYFLVQPDYLSFDMLNRLYNHTPGLPTDKLKEVLTFVWFSVKDKAKGIVLAYDEAQTLANKPNDGQFPLVLLLETVYTLQKLGIPYILILSGLPTIFPKLVQARTYSERMFKQITLDRLSPEDARRAIEEPINASDLPVKLPEPVIEEIIEKAAGNPYFIQFLCRHVYDLYLQQSSMNLYEPHVGFDSILRKMDIEFYQLRWDKATDKQKELLKIIALLYDADTDFSIKEILENLKGSSIELMKPASINIMLGTLIDSGFVFKNKRGKYSFAIPLLSQFIRREIKREAK